MTTKPPDRRDAFVLARKPKPAVPDFIITIRQPPRAAQRYVARHRVILSNGQIKGGTP
jgi:hypothetical protein